LPQAISVTAWPDKVHWDLEPSSTVPRRPKAQRSLAQAELVPECGYPDVDLRSIDDEWTLAEVVSRPPSWNRLEMPTGLRLLTGISATAA
jgi:hypothetical protein